ncbi:hypothetical protein NU688_32760 [Variovorax sp. ZS18.2.2]|uniref:hypothetical protein n=1 Tax=Variovorax sp. ZS18.2.2 TaxID=2971255 RepID=UPI002151108E|nr:hypothetical protein [Variovorax sp. ZS18.2.2]MCR6480968.1 hypothetical protein [Variovorax sp. ZS18.2.2]
MTATQRAANLKLIPPEDVNTLGRSTDTRMNSSQKSYLDKSRDSLLSEDAPLRNATARLDPNFEPEMTHSMLSIDDIDFYDRNPRTGLNPRYDELRESIKVDGITNLLTVTKRPGTQVYMPYGGGNTRLAIAKALYAEGDMRFAKLFVMIKAWPGDASAISAHLVENEVRGDISFWEKAQGVAAFKTEFEFESGRILAAPELHQELRRKGLNYSIRVLQDFSFAVQKLAPIGVWLRSKEVNVLLRPAISSIADLAEKFGVIQSVETAITETLNSYSAFLSKQAAKNAESGIADHLPTELDANALIVELHEAVAPHLGVEPSQIPLMGMAIVQNPRIDVAALRETGTHAAHSPTARTTPATSPLSPLVQAPLAGMLSSVAKASPSPSVSAPATGAGPGPAPGPGPASSSPFPAAAPANEQAQASHGGEANLTHESMLKRILDSMGDLNALVPLYDVLNSAPALPFGYMVDFPMSMSHVDGVELDETTTTFRRALWKWLVSQSGQMNREVNDLISLEDDLLLWARTISQGPAVFQQTCASHKADLVDGEIALTSLELWHLFTHPLVAPALAKFMTALHTFRSKFPERIPTSYVPVMAPR